MALKGEGIWGEFVWASMPCVLCGKLRHVIPTAGKEVDDAIAGGYAQCALLQGVHCHDDTLPSSRYLWQGVDLPAIVQQAVGTGLLASHPSSGMQSAREKSSERGGMSGKLPEVKKEVEEKDDGERMKRLKVKKEEGEDEDEDEDEVQITGFSSAALQFYKATGKSLPAPEYKGEASEVTLLAWQRGAERYFRTYGIQQEVEKVTIGADLLKGEAATWWNGLWITGREAEIRSWEEFLDKLRERFLPPEGESKYIGSWRKLVQTGSVAAYADYVFRLETLCPMGSPANFKLAYFGLFPELQAEVRKYLRQHSKKILPLEQLFVVAADAEVGLRIKKEGKEGKDGKKNKEEGSGKGGRLATVQGGSEGGGKKGGSEEGGKKGNKGGSGSNSHSITGASKDSQPPRGQIDEKRIREMCWVCDSLGHGWFYCSKKKTGKGCARCGSLGHRLFSCPQRPHLTTQREAARPAQHAIAGMETIVMQVDGAPDNACILRYPIKLNNIQSSLILDSGATVNAIEATPAQPSWRKHCKASGWIAAIRGRSKGKGFRIGRG